ncbi:MAG: hypothetical protein WBM40_04745 [Thiohalocapsa sp.]
MPSLNRIILVNNCILCVVDLVVDAHTNTFGKMTFQRLVPMFYGE